MEKLAWCFPFDIILTAHIHLGGTPKTGLGQLARFIHKSQISSNTFITFPELELEVTRTH